MKLNPWNILNPYIKMSELDIIERVATKTTYYAFVVGEGYVDVKDGEKTFLTMEIENDTLTMNFHGSTLTQIQTMFQVFTKDLITEKIQVHIEWNEFLKTEVKSYYMTNQKMFYQTYWFVPVLKSSVASNTFLQLPFLPPVKFMDLPYAKMILYPQHLSFEESKQPLHLMCQKQAMNNVFRLLPRSSFYSSKRPITSMTQIRSPKYKVMEWKRPNGYKGQPFCMNGLFFIPVIRYCLGVNTGCYFDPDPQHTYYGTFYYWEPESTVFLTAKKMEYYISKIDFALDLLYHIKEDNDDMVAIKDTLCFHIETILEDMYKVYKDQFALENKTFEEQIEKIKQSIPYMDQLSYFEREVELETRIEEQEDLHWFVRKHCLDSYLEKRLFFSELLYIYEGRCSKLLSVTKFYESELSNTYMKKLFYASEDELDQVIAKGGAAMGYELIVLGRMAGGNRVVTEVLDCRNRKQSLNHLVWEAN